MKKKLKKAAVVFLFVLLALVAGVFIFRKQIAAYFIPGIEQLGDVLIDVRDDTCYIYPTLVLSNNTFLDLKIDTVHYDISVFGNNYWHSQKSLEVKMPSYGSDTLKFCVKIPYRDLMHDSGEQREKSDSTDLEINVTFKVSTFFGETEININKTRRIKIPTLPEIEIISITYTKIQRKQVLAEATVRIINHGQVMLVIKEFDYIMTVMDQGELHGSKEGPVLIPPSGTTYVKIPVEITPDHLGLTLFNILIDKDNYNYDLLLNGKLESTEPADITFLLEVRTEGKMELRNDEKKRKEKKQEKDNDKKDRKKDDAGTRE